jgi:hypothetical protein
MFGLAACGGGGGSGTPASSSPPSAGTSGGPSSVTITGGSTGTTGGGTGATGGAPALTASTNAVSATASPSSPATVASAQVNLTIANFPANGLYYSTQYVGTAVASAVIEWSPTLVGGAQSGSLAITLDPPALIGSGTYHDTVSARICLDAGCSTEIVGSPLSVAVTYTVTGNAISDATYDILPTTIALESPSNGATLTTTVAVTADELPPYGAYVTFTSENGGPVAGMSFKQTSGSAEPYAYGTGVLTVNLKAPAALGPGSYNDLITLSICYDSACTKPAVGSPFKIPGLRGKLWVKTAA